jgi:hypothetical protein
MSIKIAANLIPVTSGWGNWGHLQIVNSATLKEIEVQAWRFNLSETNPPFFTYGIP